MESDNLKTASLYVNNQLLSRGLLRNGQNIDFARPHKDKGGLEATMGRVISVINDLILRRDRDAEQREILSQNMRALRADALRQTTELERMTNKYMEAQRKVYISDSVERALKCQLKSAEQAARGLKEEMGRTRVLVGQTRAQCANEVRKRERIIEGMKKHISEAGRARGSNKAVGVAVITVVPGVGAETVNTTSVGVDDTGYDLRSETNEFLTELARGLSEENEQLGGLVRTTMDTLRALSGCEKDVAIPKDTCVVSQFDNGFEVLASEIEDVIQHLRHLLTNPSFVPIEEVEIREEEIVRLREGFEKMEHRWRDAVQMLEGWRKRMASSGQTVNLEELKMGLSLSPLKPTELVDENRLQLSMVMEGDETQDIIDAMDDSGVPVPDNAELSGEFSDSDQSLLDDEDAMEEISEDPSQEQPTQDGTLDTVCSVSSGMPPQLSPLRETTKGNRGVTSPHSNAFTTIIEENTWDLLQLETSPIKSRQHPESPKKKDMTPRLQPQDALAELPVVPFAEMSIPCNPVAPQSCSLPRSRSSSPIQNRALTVAAPPEHKSRIQEHTTTSSLARASTPDRQSSKTNSMNQALTLNLNPSTRLPHPKGAFASQQSPLTMATIAAKLAATEREADAARVRAKIKAARASKAVTEKDACSEVDKRGDGSTELGGEREKDVVVEKRKPSSTAKRNFSGRAAGRRRSTLSPRELESLMLAGVGTGEGDS